MVKEFLPHYLEAKHPYGCKYDSFLTPRPHIGCDEFSRFADEVILNILSFLDASSLLHSSAVNKVLYVYSNYNDLWRDLTLVYCKQFHLPIHYQGSWRDTLAYAQTGFSHRRTHRPIPMAEVHSNTIARSWACIAYDLKLSLPKFYSVNNVATVNDPNIPYQDFVSQYESKNIPVVIKNAVAHWPCLVKWTDEYLATTCGDQVFRATSAMASSTADFTMEQYLSYSKRCKEEVPLYLFERNFASHESLRQDFSIPDLFDSNKHPTMDLFRLFGSARPDHRWLIIGPAKSGSIFHIDPNMTNAWNAVIRGRKKWIFYPPHVSPPGVISSKDGADVTVPLSLGEWLLSFWPYHLHAREDPDPTRRPLEVIVGPGDLIFVPHGYWHMVINLEESIAITQNYVSDSNLTQVLRFLRDKPDQISGVRDRCGEAVQPDEIFSEFVGLLKVNLPSLVEDKWSDLTSKPPPSLSRNVLPKKPDAAEAASFSFRFDV